ncbi:MAG: GNAT family N-acetyltransferase [Anaerolineae bacterium]|nr:GNAT family N-acetyltransferase [Anaerolineae bacterium]
MPDPIAPPIFETERLLVRQATPDDAPLCYALWTEPRVMVNVGFPKGLPITLAEVKEKLATAVDSPFASQLVIVLKADGQAVGECFMGLPNDEGIAQTDVKLLPDYWRRKLGVEVKRGLLDYLFTHTDCTAVEATPNVNNIASIKMQERVGGVCMGTAVYEFPQAMQTYTTPVHHAIYRVYREHWLAAKKEYQTSDFSKKSDVFVS